MPTLAASSWVAAEVGIPRILSPARTCSPRSRTACTPVEPAPRPTISPSRTKRRLALAAASFSLSLAMPSDRNCRDRLLYRVLDQHTNCCRPERRDGYVALLRVFANNGRLRDQLLAAWLA